MTNQGLSSMGGKGCSIPAAPCPPPRQRFVPTTSGDRSAGNVEASPAKRSSVNSDDGRFVFLGGLCSWEVCFLHQRFVQLSQDLHIFFVLNTWFDGVSTALHWSLYGIELKYKTSHGCDDQNVVKPTSDFRIPCHHLHRKNFSEHCCD